MARASFDSNEFYTPSSFGFIQKAGDQRRGEIVDNKFRYINMGGTLATVEILSIAEIDEAGNRISDPIEHDVLVEMAPFPDGSGVAQLIKVRPGIADNPDEDPHDTAEDGVLVLGAEGNTLFTDDGFRYNTQRPFGVLMHSFREKGFKVEILHRAYGPDIVGTQAVFVAVPDATGKTNKRGEARVNLAVDQFLKYPYEKAKASKATASTKPASKANGAAAAKPAATPVPVQAESNGHVEVDEDLSTQVIMLLRGEFPKFQKPASRQKIANAALLAAMSLKGDDKQTKEQITAIGGLLKNKAWFDDNLVMLGGVNTGDDQYKSAE